MTSESSGWYSALWRWIRRKPMYLMDKEAGARYAPFTDIITGEAVYYWLDGGNIWLSTNKWGWFRVRVAEGSTK